MSARQGEIGFEGCALLARCSAMGAFHIFTTKELRAAGETVASIRLRIARRELFRIIAGWYGDPSTPQTDVLAMRTGGRLGCVSALRLHGAWHPPDCGMHISFPSGASGRRSAGRAPGEAVVRHWHDRVDRTGSAFGVVPLELALAEALQCQPNHYLIAILDSLLHRRLMSRNRLEAIVRRAPARVHHLLDHLDARSESGTESITRYRLAMSGLATRIQVTLRQKDRLDLELDGWLAIEIDGRAHHAQEQAFTRDRKRVVRILREGRLVLQFTYATVIYDWDFVVETVRAVIDQYAPVT
jgi:very-short-patch-repair endonuclease